MIVDDLNVESIPCAPREANSPLVIDTDGVLSRSVAFQLFQVIARYATKFIKSACGMDCDEFLQGTLLHVTGNPSAGPAGKKLRGLPRCEAPDHQAM
jgi:hypothetical protein